MTAVRVAVGSGDALVRDLLRVVLAESEFVTVVALAGVGAEIAALDTRRVDVALVDVDLFSDGDTRYLAVATGAGVRCLVIADRLEPVEMGAMLDAGAAGVVSFDSSREALIEAIGAAARGEAVLHSEAATILLHQWRSLRSERSARGSREVELTPREAEVLTAMAEGLSTKAIARQLGLAVKTVENHKTRLFGKLDVRSHAHAVRVAIEQGLVNHRRELARSDHGHL